MSIIDITSITVGYGNKTVLENLSLNIPKKEILSVVGRNGSGKSTLIKVLSKTIHPSKGNVFYANRSIYSIKSRSFAKIVATLPQIHTTPKDITVGSLVEYGRFPHRKHILSGLTKEDYEIVNDSMNKTDIYKFRFRKVNTLSGGEMQRVWIAMVLAQQPSILLLDEPTSYLDISHQIEILELIRKLQIKTGITVVMVLHDLNLAMRYSDKIAILNDKKIYKPQTATNIITEDIMSNTFLIKADFYQDKRNRCPFLIPHKIEVSR